MRKKILLIGSCGFLLSNFLRKNLFHKEHNYYYIGLDKWTEKHSFYNKYQHPLHKFYLGDVCDKYLLEQIFKAEKPDIVIFGAKSDDLGLSKLIGIQNLVINAFERLIYLSDVGLYGQHPSQSIADEQTNIFPISYNLCIDAAIEKLIEQCFFNRYQIVRTSHVFGQRLNQYDWFYECMYYCYKNSQYYLSNKGSNEIDHLYIDDFCSGLNAILENGQEGQIYNLCSGESISELEMFYEISKNFKDYKLSPTFSENTFNWHEKISNQKLKNLGWKPNLKWKSQIQEMVGWYQNNQWAFKL